MTEPWRLDTMQKCVALMLANGIEPRCELIASSYRVSLESVQAEVLRKRTNVPPNTDTGCEAK
jgi:hypothetical protein